MEDILLLNSIERYLEGKMLGKKGSGPVDVLEPKGDAIGSARTLYLAAPSCPHS